MEDLNLSVLEELHPQLIEMAKMTEQDVVKIWSGPENLDLIEMQYSWDAPLYEKMVWRFRQNKNSPFGFCHSCDSVNKYKPLYYYDIYHERESDIVEFFSWIWNYICIYDFYDLFGINSSVNYKDIEDSKNYQNLRVNELVFWLGLPEKVKENLVIKYNSDVVDSYNILIKSEKINEKQKQGILYINDIIH